MTEVTRDCFCMIHPPREGVPLCNSRRADIMEGFYARTARSDSRIGCDVVEENFEVMDHVMVRESHSEILVELIEVVSEVCGTRPKRSIPCDRNRKRRPWDKSNHR